jgi:aryl-phospho-beta-D-glucosidase BglC (GH1 family)
VLRTVIALSVTLGLVLAGVTPASAASGVGIAVGVAVAKSDGPFRGINVAGAEFSSLGVPAFEKRQSFAFLASRGYSVVRIPFLWESMQPTLSGDLAPAAMDKLQSAITDAADAGLSVILDVHNYAIYDGRTYGDPGSFTEADFADLWRRLAETFRSEPAVVGYGLMNEPRALPTVNGVSGNLRWQHAQQAALDAIRATGDTTCVMVSGYTAGTMGGWLNTTHGQPEPYITDPADNFRWEAHHYWDVGSTGKYMTTYSDAVSTGFGTSQGDAVRTRTYFELNQWIEWLEKYDQKGFIGEFGWPSSENAGSEADAAAWNSLAEMYLNRIDAADPDLVWTTAWATGARWSARYSLQFYGATDGVLTTPLSNAAVLEAAARKVLPPVVPPIEPPAAPPVDPPGAPPVDPPLDPVAPVDPPTVVEQPVTDPVDPAVASEISPAPPVAVPPATSSKKAKSTVKVKVSTSKKRPKLKVTVTSRLKVTGTVIVRDRGKVVAKAKLVKGKATIIVRKKLTKGLHRFVVSYAGTTKIAKGSKSGVRFRVR